MKNICCLALVLLPLTLISCTPRQGASELRGWVSDARCTTAHVGGKDPGCVRKCAKGGAHIGHPEWAPQPLVLIEDDTNRVIYFDNAAALTGCEAEHVTVQVRHTNKRELHIEKVQRDS